MNETLTGIRPITRILKKKFLDFSKAPETTVNHTAKLSKTNLVAAAAT